MTFLPFSGLLRSHPQHFSAVCVKRILALLRRLVASVIERRMTTRSLRGFTVSEGRAAVGIQPLMSDIGAVKFVSVPGRIVHFCQNYQS